MIVKNKELSGYKYKVAYPNNFDNKNKFPLLFFFHGAGERGENLEKLKLYGPLKEIENGKEFPFIVVAPLCKENETWLDVVESMKKFILSIIDNEYVDKEHIYISGVSMGGYMTYQLLMSLSNIFAAGIICCGGGMYWNAEKIKTPVWVFHGLQDETVFFEESVKMVNAINMANGHAKLSIYEDLSHNCCDKTFENDEIYKWLLTHKKS